MNSAEWILEGRPPMMPESTTPTDKYLKWAIAELLGWTHLYTDLSGTLQGRPPEGLHSPLPVPNWPSNIADAHSLESELERRGLAERYADELYRNVVAASLGAKALFRLAHASPADRAAAAWRVLEAAEQCLENGHAGSTGEEALAAWRAVRDGGGEAKR